jgi:hypothetical protein
MSGINQTVQAAIREVEEREAEILLKPSIYLLTVQKKLKLRNKIAERKVPVLKLYTLLQIKNILTSPQKYIRDAE